MSLHDCARKQGSYQNWPGSQMESSTGQRWDIFSIKKNNDYNVLKAGKYRKLKVHNDLKKQKDSLLVTIRGCLGTNSTL